MYAFIFLPSNDLSFLNTTTTNSYDKVKAHPDKPRVTFVEVKNTWDARLTLARAEAKQQELEKNGALYYIRGALTRDQLLKENACLNKRRDLLNSGWFSSKDSFDTGCIESFMNSCWVDIRKISTTNPSTIELVLSSLHEAKTRGADSISSCFFRHLSHSISNSLSVPFKGIKRTRNFPSSWKNGAILPLPESESPSSNYGPVTLLKFSSKFLE